MCHCSLADNCPADEMEIPYFSQDGNFIGSLTAQWPSSPVGLATLPCPCGNISDTLFTTTTRLCLQDSSTTNKPQWRLANVSQCQLLSFTLCNISNVRTTVATLVCENKANESFVLWAYACGTVRRLYIGCDNKDVLFYWDLVHCAAAT